MTAGCPDADEHRSRLLVVEDEERLAGFAAGADDYVVKPFSQAWGYATADPNSVESQISKLRRKLEAHGPAIIRTVRAVRATC